MTEEKDGAIPHKMVDFALNMAQDCEAVSKKAYAEADAATDLNLKINYTQKATAYSHMQILFGMVYVTMSSVNALSDKLVKKEDVDSIKNELTQKVEKYLGPLEKETDEWNQRREESAKNTNAG
jgi:F0F1-type ATP synthase epsilon subunit